ncbi:hypothetical protein HMI55_004992 [Coelomomyces lativittatus]|nr:hypothetical protein HMI55_004992 [Coelomomyces lativittatus]
MEGDRDPSLREVPNGMKYVHHPNESMFQVSTLPTTTTTVTPLLTLNSVDVVDFGNTEDAVWSVAMNSKVDR